jgi:tetratricopeptide (TPR) repeat protein
MLKIFQRRIPLQTAILLLLLLLFTFASQAEPQQGARADHKARLKDIQNKIAEAGRLLRQDPQQALDLLRALNDKYPGQELVMVRLGQLYQSVGESDSAKALFQECLEKNRNNLEAGKSLIMAHYSSGEDKEADALLESMVKDSRYSMPAYRMAGSALMELGKHERALSLFRSGRTRSDTHYRLTMQIADLELTMGDFQEALSEYINYVERFPQNYKVAKKKITDLFHDINVDTTAASASTASTESAVVLLQLAEQRAENSQQARRELHDILSGVYLILDLLERALAAALEADHHQMEDGETLRALGVDLRGRYLREQRDDRYRYFDLTLRAMEAYIERHPRSLHLPRVEFDRATMFADAGSGFVPGIAGAERQAMLDKAIDELDRIFKKYPGSEEAALATLKKGDLIFEAQRQPEEALQVYMLGLKAAGGSRQAFVQRIGNMHIVLEEYDHALKHFRRYIRTDSESLRETGIYYTGIILSFTGQYDSARDTLTALAQQNPASPYTNDAIELAWIIEEGRQKDVTLLGVFVQSLKAELAFDTTGVVENLEEIASQGPGAALHSRALFKLGEAYALMGDYSKAMDRLQRFLADYPKHDLRPDVHRAIAQVYEYGYGDVELALEEYKHILLMYPGYIFLDEVRKDIGRLQPKETYN